MSYFKTGSATDGNASRWGMQYPRPHHGMVSEYQVSGIPYVTCSGYIAEGGKRQAGLSTSTPVEVTFPYVTRWFEVKNTGAANSILKVGFSSNGVGTGGTLNGQNCIALSGSESTGRLELKCKALYFMQDGSNSAQFQVIAGLTNVYKDDFPILSGSKGVNGVG